MALCFPGWDQGWLCWVVLTPLISAIWFSGSGSVRRAAALGYVAGLAFYWPAFHWLTTVTGIGWFLLAFYMALYPAAWGAFIAYTRPAAGDFTRSGANLRLALAGAAAWVALEWVRGWLFSGFGWNTLGSALHGQLAFIQIAELTGVGGLSALVVLTNLIAVITVQRFRSEIHTRRIRPHWDFSVTMAVIALIFLYGVRALFRPVPEGTTELRVAAVQPNIPQYQKFDPAFEDAIFERLTHLTQAALALEPQLLLWPEAATPRGLFADQRNFAFVRDLAEQTDAAFLLGTLDHDAERRDYNIAALLTHRAKAIQTYRKMHLVPFGEYIPFRQSFPLFAWVVGDLVPSDFTPGTEPVVMEFGSEPAVRTGVLICFEDTLGELTRRFVLGGAQILVNVTNDGWFLDSPASRQHLANAIFRAVENRRPLVRAANTGVTAFIDAQGRVTHRLEALNTEGILAGVVPLPSASAPLTFYTRHGERFSQACVALALLALLRARLSKPTS